MQVYTPDSQELCYLQQTTNARKIEWWGVGVVICLERGADCFAHGLADATAIPKPHYLLPHLNTDSLPRWYQLTQVVPEQVSEQFPNGTSAHYKLSSAIKLVEINKVTANKNKKEMSWKRGHLWNMCSRFKFYGTDPQICIILSTPNSIFSSPRFTSPLTIFIHIFTNSWPWHKLFSGTGNTHGARTVLLTFRLRCFQQMHSTIRKTVRRRP